MSETSYTVQIKQYTKKAVATQLSSYCSFATKESGNFIEVTEWLNGDGFDVRIHDVMGQHDFRLTYGEFKALKQLIKKLNKN